jgi:hypothetical protein
MPWAMSYWLEAYKYWVPYWPPNEQDVITEQPGPNNPTPNHRLRPTNPSDPGPWTWGNYWQYEYEPKVLGAFSSRRVQMWPEDLVNYPPFGNVKVSTPSQGPGSYMGVNIYDGPTPIYLTPRLPLWKAKQKLNRGETIDFTADDRQWFKKQYALTPVYVTPPENPWGPRIRKVAPNWLNHTEPISADDVRRFINDDMREVKTQLDKARHKRWGEKLPQRAKKQPSKDLFS